MLQVGKYYSDSEYDMFKVVDITGANITIQWAGSTRHDVSFLFNNLNSSDLEEVHEEVYKFKAKQLAR
jgi:hypothetical protein